jgi:hypothetical protein
MIIDTGHYIDDKPMKETEFYKWLSTRQVSPVGYTDIIKWLEETFGFDRKEDTIPTEQYTALSWIHDHWFRHNRRRD